MWVIKAVVAFPKLNAGYTVIHYMCLIAYSKLYAGCKCHILAADIAPIYLIHVHRYPILFPVPHHKERVGEQNTVANSVAQRCIRPQ